MTLNIDDSLLSRAAQLAGVKEKTAPVRLGLEALIARESALGWIDGHLLASALISRCALWTLDEPLQRAAAGLRIFA